jgi:hypothetical protein
MTGQNRQQFDTYVASELTAVRTLLAPRTITLETAQPHISGERFLMSGKKVVLVARDDETDRRMIIKSSADPGGIQEIEKEREARTTLANIPFAYHPLLAPRELWYERTHGRVTVATEFIEQPVAYLSLPLIEQFDLILQAFTMLTGVHAATSSHTKIIRKSFGTWSATQYLDSAQVFLNSIKQNHLEELVIEGCATAVRALQKEHKDITRYCDFLTHDDFALHNFRFTNGAIYLIDQSSLRFGNKHESWARFLNYMLLYGHELEAALVRYLKDNTAPEELRSLRLMRIYKALELIAYHSLAATRTEGTVRELSTRRVAFWYEVLSSLLVGTKVDQAVIDIYKHDRDTLRSEEEIARQRALQQLM